MENLKELTLDANKLMIGKKEVKIFLKQNTSLYMLAFTSGGEIPEKLSGCYTSAILAVDAVKAYNRLKAK